MNKEQHLNKLVDTVLSFYSNENVFGFQDLDHTESGLKHLHKAGFSRWRNRRTINVTLL